MLLWQASQQGEQPGHYQVLTIKSLGYTYYCERRFYMRSPSLALAVQLDFPPQKAVQGWVRLGRVRSGRVGSGRVGLGRVGSGRVRSGRVGLGWVRLGWVGSGQVGSGSSVC